MRGAARIFMHDEFSSQHHSEKFGGCKLIYDVNSCTSEEFRYYNSVAKTFLFPLLANNTGQISSCYAPGCSQLRKQYVLRCTDSTVIIVKEMKYWVVRSLRMGKMMLGKFSPCTVFTVKGRVIVVSSTWCRCTDRWWCGCCRWSVRWQDDHYGQGWCCTWYWNGSILAVLLVVSDWWCWSR